MAIRALDLVTKLSSRFAYEILPVTMASVIGAVLVNHYNHQPPSPPIVIQSPPSASENAIAQSLHEEHEFIAAFMKRDQENASGGDRPASAAGADRIARPAIPFIGGSANARATTSGAENVRKARAKNRGEEKVRAGGDSGA